MDKPVCASPQDLVVSYFVRFSYRRVMGLLFSRLTSRRSSKVAPVDKLSVVLVAIFAVIFLQERPAAKDWLGIALVAAGVVLLGLKR